MKYKRRKALTLIEVLISMMLCTLCLFPLLVPHVMHYRYQQELYRKIKMNEAISLWYAGFYQELARGVYRMEQLPFDAPQPIENLPEKASFMVMEVKEKQNEQEALSLLKITIGTATSGDYIYYVVVRRDHA